MCMVDVVHGRNEILSECLKDHIASRKVILDIFFDQLLLCSENMKTRTNPALILRAYLKSLNFRFMDRDFKLKF